MAHTEEQSNRTGWNPVQLEATVRRLEAAQYAAATKPKNPRILGWSIVCAVLIAVTLYLYAVALPAALERRSAGGSEDQRATAAPAAYRVVQPDQPPDQQRLPLRGEQERPTESSVGYIRESEAGALHLKCADGRVFRMKKTGDSTTIEQLPNTYCLKG